MPRQLLPEAAKTPPPMGERRPKPHARAIENRPRCPAYSSPHLDIGPDSNKLPVSDIVLRKRDVPGLGRLPPKSPKRPEMAHRLHRFRRTPVAAKPLT